MFISRRQLADALSSARRRSRVRSTSRACVRTAVCRGVICGAAVIFRRRLRRPLSAVGAARAQAAGWSAPRVAARERFLAAPLALLAAARARAAGRFTPRAAARARLAVGRPVRRRYRRRFRRRSHCLWPARAGHVPSPCVTLPPRPQSSWGERRVMRPTKEALTGNGLIRHHNGPREYPNPSFRRVGAIGSVFS